MSSYKDTSQAIDLLLIGLGIGTITGAMLVAPNAVQLLDKPLQKMLDNLDERQRQRELSKLRSYLKTQGLVRGDYDHGIYLTEKARRRIKKHKRDDISIKLPEKWDGCWRIVMFDIPETKRQNRIQFTRKIQELGFQILQQSVWIHPYECREEISVVAALCGVERAVTYMETTHIDNEQKLTERFAKVLKTHG